MNDDFKNTSEIIREATHNLMEVAAEVSEAARRALSNGERRYLEYFWNPKRQELRTDMPLQVIAFLEAESRHDSLHSAVDAQVRADITGLAAKGYLTISGSRERTTATLTNMGVAYVKDAHPKLIVLWERLLERTPKPWSLVITLVGFAASIFGIIQFFHG